MKDLDDKEVLKLKLLSIKIRKHIIEMLTRAKSGHPGGSLSCVEALVSLYFAHIKHDPNNPVDPDRDRFILSKGHAAPALYAVLAESGYFDIDELGNLRVVDCMLQGHPACTLAPGIEASTGSLGHGLSFGSGHALAGKLDKKDYKVYVMLGDGETDEGQVWEAATVASHYKLDNITAMIDRNFLQIDGNTEDVLSLEPVNKRWSAFGWNVIETDGHDIKKILDALKEADTYKGKPSVIILKTTKGKDISFMENVVDFHGVPPKEEERDKAIKELDLLKKKLEAKL
jgi:transketolase